MNRRSGARMRPVSSPRKLVTGDQAGLPGGGDTNDEAQSGESYSGSKQAGGARRRDRQAPGKQHS